MITLSPIKTLSEFNPTGIDERIVAVRIIAKPSPFTVIFSPEQNRIGTELLARLLTSRLEQNGVKVTEVHAGQPFNKAYLFFVVSNLGEALAVVKDEISALLLLEWTQIAWRDSREGVWRLHHTPAGGGEFAELTPEEQKVEADILAAVYRYLGGSDEPTLQ